MDWRLIFFSSYETVLSVVFGLVTIFLSIKILDLTILRVREGAETDSALNQGNVALGILCGTVIISILILVQSSILPAVSNMQTMATGRDSISFMMVVKSMGMFILYYVVATIISIVILFLSIAIYMWGTTKIDEIAEIKKNNIAISVMLSMVILGMTIFIRPSVNRFISSWVDYRAGENTIRVEKKKGEGIVEKQVAPEGSSRKSGKHTK